MDRKLKQPQQVLVRSAYTTMKKRTPNCKACAKGASRASIRTQDNSSLNVSHVTNSTWINLYSMTPASRDAHVRVQH